MTRAYPSEAPVGQAPAFNHGPLQIEHTLIGIFDKKYYLIPQSSKNGKMEFKNLCRQYKGILEPEYNELCLKLIIIYNLLYATLSLHLASSFYCYAKSSYAECHGVCTFN
jgi:hypothetical protein